MEFTSSSELPSGAGWQYEPKWDGFRPIVARRRRVIQLWSKAGKPLERYFPEIVGCISKIRSQRFVLDGELVVATRRAGSFDDLLQRIHPAQSRIVALAKSNPAKLVVFDMLSELKAGDISERPLKDRRRMLERFAKSFRPARCIALSPVTSDRRTAQRWLARSRSEFDGVVAKRLDQPYESGSRKYGVKVKRKCSADCVVGGFRYAANGNGVGSLLLGLYDGRGRLNHVGFVSGFEATERVRLAKRLRPLIEPPGFTGRAPGGASRWRKRADDWLPLAPKLVVEVTFDKVTSGRIRHAAGFVRWRPDKHARQCTMMQLSR